MVRRGRIWVNLTCSGREQRWVHLQRSSRSSVLCCLSVCCNNVKISHQTSEHSWVWPSACFPVTFSRLQRTHFLTWYLTSPPSRVFKRALTFDSYWRTLQPSAPSPSPLALLSPATSAAGLLRLHPSPRQSHRDMLTLTAPNTRADNLHRMLRCCCGIFWQGNKCIRVCVHSSVQALLENIL